MRNLKYVKKQGAKGLVTLVLTFILVTALSIPAFAINDGDTVSYTSSHEMAHAEIDGTSFTGSCALLGVPMASSGTASARKISNSTWIAKAIYHYKQLGYDTWPTSGEPQEPGWEMTHFNFLTDLTQIYGMGFDAWRALFESEYGTGATDYIRQKMEEASSFPTPPNNFEVYFLDAQAGYQDIIIWGLVENQGDLTVSKVTTGAGDISSQSFTFEITVSGVDGTYSGVTFTGGKATISLRGGESKKIEGLPADASYTVVEKNIPSTWTLKSRTKDSGTIVKDVNTTATFTNAKKPGKVKLKKASAIPSITG